MTCSTVTDTYINHTIPIKVTYEIIKQESKPLVCSPDETIAESSAHFPRTAVQSKPRQPLGNSGLPKTGSPKGKIGLR